MKFKDEKKKLCLVSEKTWNRNDMRVFFFFWVVECMSFDSYA